VTRSPARAVAIAALGVLCALWVAARAAVSSGALIERARFVPGSDAWVVVDRSGLPLRLARVDGVDRRWARLAEIPPSLVQAVLAVEDARFFAHDGVDRRAIARAVADHLIPGRARSGGSTITQQLVKRVYGRPHGALSKLAEVLRAMTLERVMSKDEILEQYLNRLPYGDEVEGVTRACEGYFGHDLATLTVSEAALLAAIPRAPSALDPRRHPARADVRRRWVLRRMRVVGALDDAGLARALDDTPTISAVPTRPWVAPRFVDRVLEGVRRGAILRDAPGRVRSSLDLATQRRTESLLRAQWASWASRGAKNAAAIVVSNATGEVLAYVGAVDPAGAGGALDLLDAPRQPGSTLKPFAYELFFERGGSAATMLEDAQVAMTGAGGARFEARDYDGVERGPVRARDALAASLNLAALDVARRVGQDALAARLRAMGFRGVGDGDAHGGALVLGGVGVRGVELAEAWVTLARWGTRAPLSLVPIGGPVRGERVLHGTHARVTWDVLADPAARRAGFGDSLEALAPGLSFALKTGTSANWRDAWCAVATDRVTALVWLGDPDGRPMAEVSGFRAAAPAAVRIARAAHERAVALGIPPYDRRAPALVTAEVCPWSGLRAGPRCRGPVRERFAPGTIPTASCDQHDPQGRWIAPARLQAWAARAQHPEVSHEYTHRHSYRSEMAVREPVVREPRDGARWLLEPGASPASIALRVTVGGVDVRADRWEADGVALEGDRWTLRPGEHALVARVGGRASAPSRVTVLTTLPPRAPSAVSLR
jgi:penicillin-binding protein 1C